MVYTRRNVLKMAGLSAMVLFCPSLVSRAAAESGHKTLSTSSVSQAAPLKARRWAMVIRLGKCPKGCKDCLVACHETHNVPEIDHPRHNIRWIANKPFENVFPGGTHRFLPELIKGLSIPVLCNHCDNPSCVRVCPTGATFKRADGITMMDYHRCIGCRFCMAACPYGSRSMNYRDPRPFIKKINPNYPTRTAGVVEKCNFCEDRLARGLLPACVLACRDKAMIFGDVEDSGSEIRSILSSVPSLRRRPELGTGPQIYYIL